MSSEAMRVLGRERSRARLASSVGRAFAWLLAFALLFVSTLAHAAPWSPPPLRGHVVDQAGALTPDQTRLLDRKLDRARKQTGFAIVVYLLPQLPDGLSIEDVGYRAGNAWGVGSKSGDDGVLLIASLGERKLRIETGKGVGGALTDLQSSRINREVIGPAMKEGRTYDAMNQGVDAILHELVENTPGGKSDPGRDPSASRRGHGAQGGPATVADYMKIGVIGLIIVGVIILAIVSPTFREILFWVLLFGRFGGGGGRRDDDDGGSGYGGGGGSFGGGGSSDDY
ncbi:MAG TPA: TPM domain-containing protein [Labilithrix sp.]|nr:TPM domain-containing protein [Labilithrix sp.]